MVLFEPVPDTSTADGVLKDCNYWYYLNWTRVRTNRCWVLKDCNYWYYLNINGRKIFCYSVLKDCNYWYYLNRKDRFTCNHRVLKDCNYWYYLNSYCDIFLPAVFLRIVIIGIIWTSTWIKGDQSWFLRIVIIGIIWTLGL